MWKDTGCWGERTSTHCSGSIHSRGWNCTLMGEDTRRKTFSFYQISIGPQLQSRCTAVLRDLCHLTGTATLNTGKKKKEEHDVGFPTVIINTSFTLSCRKHQLREVLLCSCCAVYTFQGKKCTISWYKTKHDLIWSKKRSCLSYLSDRVSVINPALSPRPAKISAIWGN